MSNRGVAVIEGSLQNYDDDDSSEDEEDPQQGTTTVAPITHHRIVDDGDEELEVFTGAVPRAPTKNVVEPSLLPPVPPANNVNKTKLSLIDAMEASVRQVEDQIRFEDEHARSRQSSEKTGNPPSSSPPPIAFFDPVVVPVPTATTDVFGIVYKPLRKKKEDYQLPSGPAFEDEAEFERELSQPVKAQELVSASETEDDEFDFDDSTAVTVATTTTGGGHHHGPIHLPPLATTKAASSSSESRATPHTMTMTMMSLQERQAMEAEEERRIVISLMAENARMTGEKHPTLI